MNGYVDALQKVIEQLKTERRLSLPEFRYERSEMEIVKYGGSVIELVVLEMKSDEFIHFLDSRSRVRRRTIGSIVGRCNGVDWVVQWLELILHEMDVMTGLGFQQTGFTSYRIQNMEVFRDAVGSDSVVMIENERNSCHYCDCEMDQAFVRFVRNHLSIENILKLPSELRDLTIEGGIP